MNEISFPLGSPQQTTTFAISFGKQLKGGDIIALHGTLGAGKTHFVQGLALGLDVSPDIYVCSPTYTLMDSYPGRLMLYHFDLYRLGDIDELEEIGWRDCLEEQAVVAIEWANRLEDYLPEDHIEMTLSVIESESRLLTIKWEGERYKWIEDCSI